MAVGFHKSTPQDWPKVHAIQPLVHGIHPPRPIPSCTKSANNKFATLAQVAVLGDLCTEVLGRRHVAMGFEPFGCVAQPSPPVAATGSDDWAWKLRPTLTSSWLSCTTFPCAMTNSWLKPTAAEDGPGNAAPSGGWRDSLLIADPATRPQRSRRRCRQVLPPSRHHGPATRAQQHHHVFGAHTPTEPKYY